MIQPPRRHQHRNGCDNNNNNSDDDDNDAPRHDGPTTAQTTNQPAQDDKTFRFMVGSLKVFISSSFSILITFFFFFFSPVSHIFFTSSSLSFSFFFTFFINIRSLTRNNILLVSGWQLLANVHFHPKIRTSFFCSQEAIFFLNWEKKEEDETIKLTWLPSRLNLHSFSRFDLPHHSPIFSTFSLLFILFFCLHGMTTLIFCLIYLYTHTTEWQKFYKKIYIGRAILVDTPQMSRKPKEPYE